MKCPDCKEIIKKYTPICAHCGISITTEEIGHYDLGHPTNWNLSAQGMTEAFMRHCTLLISGIVNA